MWKKVKESRGWILMQGTITTLLTPPPLLRITFSLVATNSRPCSWGIYWPRNWHVAMPFSFYLVFCSFLFSVLLLLLFFYGLYTVLCSIYLFLILCTMTQSSTLGINKGLSYFILMTAVRFKTNDFVSSSRAYYISTLESSVDKPSVIESSRMIPTFLPIVAMNFYKWKQYKDDIFNV